MSWLTGGTANGRHTALGLEGKLGENRSGEQLRETAQAKAERIIGEELDRPNWESEA